MKTECKELRWDNHIEEIKISEGPLEHCQYIYVKRHGSIWERRDDKNRIRPIIINTVIVPDLKQSLWNIYPSHDFIWRLLKILHFLYVRKLNKHSWVWNWYVRYIKSILLFWIFNIYIWWRNLIPVSAVANFSTNLNLA